MKNQYLLGQSVAAEMASIMKSPQHIAFSKPMVIEKTAAKKENADKAKEEKAKAKEKEDKAKEKAKVKEEKAKDKAKAKAKEKKKAADTFRRSVNGLAKISAILDELGMTEGSLATLGALDCLIKEVSGTITKKAHHLDEGGVLDLDEETPWEERKHELSELEDEPEDFEHLGEEDYNFNPYTAAPKDKIKEEFPVDADEHGEWGLSDESPFDMEEEEGDDEDFEDEEELKEAFDSLEQKILKLG